MPLKLITSFLFVLLITVSSCCTKEDCDNKIIPKITFRYSPGSIPAEHRLLYVIDKESQQKKDSMTLYPSNQVYSISDLDLHHLQPNSLKDFDYIIKTKDNSMDTINRISYEVTARKVDCNSCFLRDGSATMQDYKDFVYYHDDKSYTKTDTLLIH